MSGLLEAFGTSAEAGSGETLTPAEFAMIREGIGVSRRELAMMLSPSPRTGQPVPDQTIQAWEKGRNRVPADVGAELEALEEQWIELINALVEHLRDSPVSTLTIPRVETDGRPPGWWRSVAHQVTLRLPGLTVVYAEAEQ